MRAGLNLQEIEEVQRRYLEGEPIAKIATECQCSAQTIAKYTKHLREERLKKKCIRLDSRDERVLNLAKRGRTAREISVESGVTEALVRSICSSNRVKIQRTAINTNAEYVPKTPLIYVAPENPIYLGFELEEDAVERLKEVRVRIIRRLLSGVKRQSHNTERRENQYAANY